MYTDRFGFLPEKVSASWPDGTVEPVAGFEEAVAWAKAHANRDHFLYPPIIHHRQYGPGEGPEDSVKVPGTERQALLQRVPVTHELVLPDASEDRETQRRGLAGFVVQFLGFLYDYRCQFEDWWLDGRLPMRPATDAAVAPFHVSTFLVTAVATWRTFSEDNRARVTNALFFHLRSRQYEWPWERFMTAYQALDAGWRVAREERPGLASMKRRVPHADRIERLCGEFGLHWDAALVERLVKLRNGLLHEALWHGSHPTEAGERELDRMPRYVQLFNVRLFLALLGVDSDFIEGAWTGMGRVALRPCDP